MPIGFRPRVLSLLAAGEDEGEDEDEDSRDQALLYYNRRLYSQEEVEYADAVEESGMCVERVGKVVVCIMERLKGFWPSKLLSPEGKAR